MTHKLNTITFTIRTSDNVLAEKVGIVAVIETLEAMDSIDYIGVFWSDDNTNGSLSAVQFLPWAKKMNNLINKRIGWDGKKIGNESNKPFIRFNKWAMRCDVMIGNEIIFSSKSAKIASEYMHSLLEA